MCRFEFTLRVRICTTTRFVQRLTTALPKSYSTDLRWHVIWLHMFLKKSVDEVATLLLTSSRTVHRYVARFLNAGDAIPQDHRNGPARLLTDFDEPTLVNLVLTNPGIYLHELKHKLTMTTGTEVDCSTICPTLKRLGITHQKIRHVAMQRKKRVWGSLWLKWQRMTLRCFFGLMRLDVTGSSWSGTMAMVFVVFHLLTIPLSSLERDTQLLL